MSVEEVRLKAFDLQNRIHRNLIVTIGTGFVVLVFAAMMIMRLPSTSPRVITAVLMLFVIVIINRAYRAFWSPDTLPPDAAPDSCIEFYRRELTAQYRAVAPTWWNLALEIALFSVIVRIAMNATFRYGGMPILLPLFWVLILSGRYWRAHRLKRELAFLDSFEKEDK